MRLVGVRVCVRVFVHISSASLCCVCCLIIDYSSDKAEWVHVSLWFFHTEKEKSNENSLSFFLYGWDLFSPDLPSWFSRIQFSPWSVDILSAEGFTVPLLRFFCFCPDYRLQMTKQIWMLLWIVCLAVCEIHLARCSPYRLEPNLQTPTVFTSW